MRRLIIVNDCGQVLESRFLGKTLNAWTPTAGHKRLVRGKMHKVTRVRKSRTSITLFVELAKESDDTAAIQTAKRNWRELRRNMEEQKQQRGDS